MKLLHHPLEEVRTLAAVALALAKRPLARPSRWKWRDFWASGGVATVPVPYALACNLIQARGALDAKLRQPPTT